MPESYLPDEIPFRRVPVLVINGHVLVITVTLGVTLMLKVKFSIATTVGRRTGAESD